jgi:hypothetical protein
MADKIRTLKEMGFGSYGNNFLQKALDAHQGDLEQTVEALLGGWTGKSESDRKSKNSKKKGGQGGGAKASKTQPRNQAAAQSDQPVPYDMVCSVKKFHV